MFRVEGRRLIGRPRRTWLESVEADMAELEIDKEDVHDRKKWRQNVMKRKANPIGRVSNVTPKLTRSCYSCRRLSHR